MLFNSHIFILVFLPVVCAGYFTFGALKRYTWAMVWLVASSLFFYGWWNPLFLWLISASIVFNYGCGRLIQRFPHRSIMLAGVMANLLLLGYYKYYHFFLNSIGQISGHSFHVEVIVLPLAISFFTFQQIAYLVDARRKVTQEHNFISYCLFVVFFPQLIAGPIVHHREMLEQFKSKLTFRFQPKHVAVGVSIFTCGLIKKVILADSVALYATPVFDAVQYGNLQPDLLTSWMALLAYTFQIYFDFSGYSDMAIGLGRIFGIHIPLNFNAPYKSISISSFWRRWHMTLSRFLRDYLYIPLGGNRHGNLRQQVNLLTTMLLGGLWHGAGWTFVIWGGLHGLYLMINHRWSAFLKLVGLQRLQNTKLYRLGAWSLTFFAVMLAWVFFRSESLPAATLLIKGLAGEHGCTIPSRLSDLPFASLLIAMGAESGHSHYFNGSSLVWIGICAIVAFFLPTTQQIFCHFLNPTTNNDETPPPMDMLCWKPNLKFAILIGLATAAGVVSLTRVSEFLYFQF